MYHYVRPSSTGLPHLPYLALTDFERQLDYFGFRHGFVSRDGFEQWVAGGALPDGVLLTFDDGLRDHVDYVLPILEARGLFAIFYVPSAPAENGVLLDVHKVHLALGRIGGERALDWLSARYPELFTASEVTGHYSSHSGDSATKRIKYAFNWQLEPSRRGPVLDELVAFAFQGSTPGWRELYLDGAGISELVSAGMGVGAHGHNHVVLTRVDAAAQREEIQRSCEFIAAQVGGLEWGYCYAHGIPTAFDSTATCILDSIGCPFAFAVRAEDIDTSFAGAPRFELPRHNCNAFPHGAATFDIEEVTP